MSLPRADGSSVLPEPKQACVQVQAGAGTDPEKKKKKKTQQLQTLVHVLNTFDAMVLAIYFMKIRHFTLFYDPLNMAILSP